MITNHDADSYNTKYISIENSTEDNADDNLEDDVLRHRHKLCQLETPSKFFEYFTPVILSDSGFPLKSVQKFYGHFE